MQESTALGTLAVIVKGSGISGRVAAFQRGLWAQPHRLRGRLTLLFLISPTLAIGLVTTYATLSYRQAQRDALLEEARTILSLLVQHHPEPAGRVTGGSAIMNAWVGRAAELPHRHPRIRYVMLRDESGNDLSGGQLKPESSPPVEPADVVLPGFLSWSGGPPIAHAAVRLNDVDGAYVQIGLGIGPAWASLAQLHHVAGILLVTLLLNIWMIRTGLRRLIVPLEQLAEGSRALAEGEDATPVSVTGPEEVAQLGTAFNQLLERREQDAQRVRTTLQELENERTKLSDANCALDGLNENLREEHAQTQFERQRFMAMVECLHEGLIYLGSDGCVEYANPEAARLLNIELETLSELRASWSLGADDVETVERALSCLVGAEAWTEARNRSELDLSSIVIHGDRDEVRGRMILLRDRTEERRLQRQMAEQDKIATLGVLAAGIAHEIYNPLDGLQNCLRRIVREPTNTTQIERYGGLMTASLGHIETVVKQLLNLSHKRDRVVQKVDVNEILHAAVDLGRSGKRWNGVQVRWQLADDLPLVLADPQNMTQVFLNLVLNALDAMAEGGDLTIVTRLSLPKTRDRSERGVIIEVRDTGHGIPSDVLPRVFEPFFTTKSHDQGTGLGLSVSRNLVIEHGGEITVESTIGKGTTFRVRLPRFFPARQTAMTVVESV